MDVVVTGIGLISVLGAREATWKHLLAARSGIQPLQPFAELLPKPLALVGTTPAELESLVVAVVLEAVSDAGLSLPLVDCAISIGSSRANQSKWEHFIRSPHPSLPSWLDTLPHAAAIVAARLVSSCGPVLAPMAACATGIWSLAQGFELIQTGRCQRVLAGAVEAPITPLTLAGFDRMAALAQTGAYPFDRDREGLVLGEGGAVLVLESAALAIARGAKIYGQILGFGLTADGYHVSAPQPKSPATIAAVQHCLHRSGLVPNDIDYIHAHGTATQLNDRHEAELIQQIFPQPVPVSSTKGATGHTLGASGALGTAFCLLAMRDGLLPPCVGLRQPEFELDLVSTARPASVRHALCLSFGFGGQNAVLALRSAENQRG
jgi:3-oxoacyl-[acyl-carrier-protein] synthase II